MTIFDLEGHSRKQTEKTQNSVQVIRANNKPVILNATIFLVTILMVCIVQAGIAFSAEVNAKATTFSTAPKLTNFGNQNLLAITDQLYLRRLNADIAYIGVNEDDPLHGASGSCYAAALIANKKLDGKGYCGLKDIDGQSFAISISMQQVNGKITKGEWKVVGGKGKWSKAKGGGQWTQYMLSNSTMTINTITGNIDF
ncbi:hypothetical protein [Polycladidibacter stylochi]|uniref:hypothetical protein n=1 Tax=Polycladidibacter stylochi TaxID=1807766 RepID=UPI00082BFDC4|nr:hypothetical protein [Pseudovibrio stylochi]